MHQSAGTAWAVAQTDNAWPVHRDRIAVDPAASTVTARSDFADWPLLAQLSGLGIQAHLGILFGVINQLLLAALAVGLLCVIVWGYRMWWQRRPTRNGRRPLVGAPPVARGTWQKLPAWTVIIGVPIAFATGWALPMLCIPLAAFLIIDWAPVGYRTQGRQTLLDFDARRCAKWTGSVDVAPRGMPNQWPRGRPNRIRASQLRQSPSPQTFADHIARAPKPRSGNHRQVHRPRPA